MSRVSLVHPLHSLAIAACRRALFPSVSRDSNLLRRRSDSSDTLGPSGHDCVSKFDAFLASGRRFAHTFGTSNPRPVYLRFADGVDNEYSPPLRRLIRERRTRLCASRARAGPPTSWCVAANSRAQRPADVVSPPLDSVRRGRCDGCNGSVDGDTGCCRAGGRSRYLVGFLTSHHVRAFAAADAWRAQQAGKLGIDRQ